MASRLGSFRLPVFRTVLSNGLRQCRQNSTIAGASPRPFLAVLGIMPIVTFGLGVWQVKRLGWKLDMIDQLERKLHRDPARLPAHIDLNLLPEFAYRKVAVQGQFDHGHEMLLGPRTREGELGYHVITPLVRGEGEDVIMVNRGFVRRDHADKSLRRDSLVQGPVELVGMLRSQDQKTAFTPQNDPSRNQWVFADLEAMAQSSGAQPILVDEIYSGNAGQIAQRLSHGVPVGRAATIEIRNQHLTYAFTWFALSAATTVMFFKLRQKPRDIVGQRSRERM